MTTVVQDTKNTNTLAQTFNNTLGGTPAQGNLLVAFLFHDENSTDVASLTSSGWLRMATASADLGGIVYRISIWAKFAGASESTTIAWDLGEVNRRAHGYVAEYSGSEVTALNAEDGATFVQGERDPAGTSLQVDSPIEIGNGQLGITMIGCAGTSPTTPSWASEVTEHEDWSNNFRASAIGYTDPAVTIQPTATWGTNRTAIEISVALGEPPPSTKCLTGSTFRVTPASS